eukprot:3621419-Prymnesium_polylepis.1
MAERWLWCAVCVLAPIAAPHMPPSMAASTKKTHESSDELAISSYMLSDQESAVTACRTMRHASPNVSKLTRPSFGRARVQGLPALDAGVVVLELVAETGGAFRVLHATASAPASEGTPRRLADERALEARQCAAVMKRALERLHARDAEDEEEERGERDDVAQAGQRAKDRRDQHWHARHQLERSERAEATHDADGGIVTQLREDNLEPGEGDDGEVDDAPRVAQVSVPVEDKALCNDPDDHLGREDCDANRLREVEHDRLGRLGSVERRANHHGHAVDRDGEEHHRIKVRRFDQEDGMLAEAIGWS